jgi:preprotein translocase subunit SecA
MRSTDRVTSAALRGYPERDDVPVSVADRVVGAMSARLQRLCNRGFADAEKTCSLIREKAEALGEGELHIHLSQLRYRLRRDGYTDVLIADCLALVSSGYLRNKMPLPPAVADDDVRTAALVLAAAAAALSGNPVHVFVRSDVRAHALAAMLNSHLQEFDMQAAAIVHGMESRIRREAYAAAVTCAVTREIGLDYLRDRIQLGERRGVLAGIASRMSGDVPFDESLLLRGLHCAFVDDAEMLMIDDARLPLMISADADQSRERLLYEQALELARALQLGRDFGLSADGADLTDTGRQRLRQLVSPLGGIWAAQARCEALIVIALRSLHEFMRDRDYQVVRGRVIFPTPPGKAGEERTEGDYVLQKLTEVKEGCVLSGQPDVLARISVPRFLGRYMRLAGVAADAHALAGEFRVLYGAPFFGETASLPSAQFSARVFNSAQARLHALVQRIAVSAQNGRAVIIALRSQSEAQVVMEALVAAGIRAGIVHGRGDDADRAALAAIGHPGAVTLSCYPAERSVLQTAEGVLIDLLVAELHDAHRHIVRLGRIYGASTCESLLSIEDPVMQALLPPLFCEWLAHRAGNGGELSPKWSRWLTRYAQGALEREQRLLREESRSRESYLDDVLAFSGRNY